MEEIGFWESLFSDIGWHEREKLNEAAQSIGTLARETGGNRDHVRKLYNLDRAQSEELERLKSIVAVLGELLIDNGVVSRESLSARIDSALRKMEEQPDTIAGGPYRGKPPTTARKRRPPKQPTVICARCSDQVLWIHTEAMEEGSVCDPCLS